MRALLFEAAREMKTAMGRLNSVGNKFLILHDCTKGKAPLRDAWTELTVPLIEIALRGQAIGTSAQIGSTYVARVS